jgi:two-component sensor histidine kinase
MSLSTFLEPTHLLQTIVLALSIFNMVAFFWLTLTVWLNGDRRTWIARLGVIGLSLSALFFFLHALLISSPLTPPSNTLGLIPPDVLWHLIWIPALGVPYIWFAIGLHYASLINEGWRRRRPLLLLSSGLLGCIVMLLLILNQSTFTFAGTLSLLVYVDPLSKDAGLFSPLILIPTLFLCYVTFCAIGPWFTFKRVIRLLHVLWSAGTQFIGFKQRAYVVAGDLREGADTSAMGNMRADTSAMGAMNWPLRRALVNAFWDDPTDVEHLQEPDLSWHLARPWLLLAALLMVGLTTTLGVLCIESMLDWLMRADTSALGAIHRSLLNSIPSHLFVLDLIATGAVALIILLIGYSIVRHGILIERPLARRGFLEQWRGIVIVATGVAIFIALLVTFTHSNLGGLLLITLLATGAYALFTWSSYTAHDHYIALLGPFVRSTSLRHWLSTDLQKTEQELEKLFFHLCQDVLAVECARLVIIAGSVRRSFSYRWPDSAWIVGKVGPERIETRFAKPNQLANDSNTSIASQSGLPAPQAGLQQGVRSTERPAPIARPPQEHQARDVNAHRVSMTLHGQPMICWVFPIYDERGLVATLYLGPRQDGGAFTDEDMDLAHACGQRILDTLGDHEAMQAVAGLLRRRIVDVKLLGAQQRRVLHDEILPQMHLALLRLETLRSTLHGTRVGPEELADQSAVGMINRPLSDSRQQSSDEDSQKAEQALDEAVEMITGAHRRLAAMMRATAPGAPHRLERDGLMHAIHTMLEQDFQNAFDEVEWYVTDETAIDEVTPPAIAEIIFAAVQEALRNAARHARGPDVHRRLRLVLKASYSHIDQVDHGRPHIEVIVADDGIGIASTNAGETTGTGGGLLTHSALLAIAGGSLTIKSTPDHGVTVRILFPLE